MVRCGATVAVPVVLYTCRDFGHVLFVVGFMVVVVVVVVILVVNETLSP